MLKIYKELTPEQKARGVVFTSTLSDRPTEQSGDTTHEVIRGEYDYLATIGRLTDDSFFNGSPWNYNIIRE